MCYVRKMSHNEVNLKNGRKEFLTTSATGCQTKGIYAYFKNNNILRMYKVK